jgi:WD40 repeat protein
MERAMDPDRWQRASELFLAALERDETSRRRFVEESAADDPELLHDVEQLLASDAQAGTFMAAAAGRRVSPALAADVPTVAPDPDAARRRFGGYEIVDEIARGGMGVVYRARQLRLNRTVALKMIPGGALASPSVVERFRAEAEAVAQLEHPNIVPIYEVGEIDGQHYFSARLIEGGSLEQRLREFALPSTTLDRTESMERQRRAARFMGTVAEAVHFAHQRGILHRDLKPGNILIDTQGDPQVTDFGIAKQLTGRGPITQSFAVLGTPDYMAPEQAAGETARLTTAADVFSLGVVLYQLLTSRLPFRGATPIETMRKVVEDDPPAPRALNGTIDADLETICLKCLAKRPSDRYTSAKALADDLGRWLAGEPITARPVTATERVWRWCRRQPIVAGLWMALALAVLAGIITSGWQWQRAQRNAVTLRENLYAADMSVAFDAWNRGNIAQVRDLLDAQRPRDVQTDLRTFEWRYLFGQARTRERLLINAGRAGVWGLAISPDGRLLATGMVDGKIRLWALPSGAPIATLDGGGLTYCLAFSPNGALLAATTDGPDVRLWDVATRTLRARLGPHSLPSIAVAFSPDGATLISTGGFPYGTDVPAELILWDVASGRRVASLTGHKASAGWPAFSPDGTLLATPQGDGTVTLWDVRTRRIAHVLKGHEGLIVAASFSPDGQLLATTGLDGTVRLWNVPRRELVSVLGSQKGAAYGVAFSPDGRRLISGGIDGLGRLWDVAGRRLLATFKGHGSRVFGVQFSPDGRFVFTGSLDGTARVWDAAVSTAPEVFDRHRGAAAITEFSSDGHVLLRSDPGGHSVTLWDANTLKQFAVLPQDYGTVSGDGRRLATTSGKELALWDISGHVLGAVRTTTLPAPVGLGPVFVPSGVAVGVQGTPPAIAISDIGSGIVQTLSRGAGDSAELLTIARSPHGDLLAAGDADGHAYVWDTRTWSVRQVLHAHADRVLALAFSPDGRWFASGSADTTVRVWGSDFAVSPSVFKAEAGFVYALAFSPDSQTLAVGTVDGLVKFWNVRARREVTALEAHRSIVSSIAFSPDGRTMATACVDQTMRLWRAPGFEETGH